ncbi:MAG: pantoate--beta-alanine ligase [Enterobacteriaceae bacterium]
MLILETPLLLRRYVRRWLLVNRRIALVPAHSPLHQGHLALIEQARACADTVVVALQPPDLSTLTTDEHTPLTSSLQQDCELLTHAQVDLLFIANPEVLYPTPCSQSTRVLASPMVTAAAFAPDGDRFASTLFATTLCKLLNLIQPDVLCVGEKEYPRLCLTRQIVQDLNYATQVLPVPIARDSDALPYSRHHAFLTEDMRIPLRLFKQQLDWLVQQLSLGERLFDQLLEQCCQKLDEAGLEVIQAEILDADHLDEVTVDSQHAVILLTVALQERQFSDNAVVNLRE